MKNRIFPAKDSKFCEVKRTLFYFRSDLLQETSAIMTCARNNEALQGNNK